MNELFLKAQRAIRFLFYKDISYGLILILILPLLDIIGQINFVSFSYLIGAIFAILIFKINYSKLSNQQLK